MGRSTGLATARSSSLFTLSFAFNVPLQAFARPAGRQAGVAAAGQTSMDRPWTVDEVGAFLARDQMGLMVHPNLAKE
jgi:hypothetical protein